MLMEINDQISMHVVWMVNIILVLLRQTMAGWLNAIDIFAILLLYRIAFYALWFDLT